MKFLKMIDRAANQAPPAETRHERPVVLALENVSKRFCRDLKRSLFYGVQDIGRELIGRPQPIDRLRRDEFWALQNVNVELRAGDVMGIIGINGCGKTTLMRIIAGLIKPTTGRITVRGRLAPLLALGAGFNQVLTGRENVYANMSVLGLTYDEITERFDDVVAFSEIGYAIDAPVQTYSSGMLARLGFACAVSTQPDILLLDEVLAVGDINFRRKCIERLFQMRSKGMSLIIVHHSPALLLAIADYALYLRRGEVAGHGAMADMVKLYERDLLTDMPKKTGEVALETDSSSSAASAEPSERFAASGVTVSNLRVEALAGPLVTPGQAASLAVSIRTDRPLEQLNTSFTIARRVDGEEALSGTDNRVLRFLSRRDGGSLENVAPGEYEIRVELPTVGLLGGLYRVHLKVTERGNVPLAAQWSDFVVASDDPLSISAFHQPRTWRLFDASGRELEGRAIATGADVAADLVEARQLEKIN